MTCLDPIISQRFPMMAAALHGPHRRRSRYIVCSPQTGNWFVHRVDPGRVCLPRVSITTPSLLVQKSKPAPSATNHGINVLRLYTMAPLLLYTYVHIFNYTTGTERTGGTVAGPLGAGKRKPAVPHGHLPEEALGEPSLLSSLSPSPSVLMFSGLRAHLAAK